MNRRPAAVLATLAMVTLSGCGSSTGIKAPPTTTATTPSAAPATSPHRSPPGAVVDGKALATRMLDAILAKKSAHVLMATHP